jgi:hypothetical protein
VALQRYTAGVTDAITMLLQAGRHLKFVGKDASKNPFHGVHIARNSVANLSVKRMDAMESGYDPQGDFHGTPYPKTH